LFELAPPSTPNTPPPVIVPLVICFPKLISLMLWTGLKGEARPESYLSIALDLVNEFKELRFLTEEKDPLLWSS